jgi:hypothetical protein
MGELVVPPQGHFPQHGPPNPGPPPRRPIEPQYFRVTHVLHLLLAFFTFGLWAIVWLIIGVSTSSANARMQREYAEACARWEHDFWVWQQAQEDWRHWRYGTPPR